LAGAGAWACALFLLALPHLGLATTRVLDFEGYAEGHILESDGDFEGITFQISDTEHYPRALVIFDSDCTLASGADPCTGGDYDLATPGAGPGNDRPQGNILILPRNVVDGDGDGNVDDPDDSTQGGDVTFSFDPWVKVRSITLIDIEEPDTEVRVVDAAGIERTFRPAHFGALGNNNAIRIDLCSAPSSGGGDCDGRIITMKFEYTGEGCSGTTNGQGGKVSCSGGATGVEPVAIRVTDRREEDVFANVAGVSIGDVFEVLAAVGGVSRLPPEIKVWIDDELEVIRIHTSCSRPLNVGDHFGSLRVVEMTTTEGGTVTIDDPNAPCPTARKLEIELDGSGGFDEIVYEDSCGDGDVDAGEECDDANPTTGDGCTPGCRAEECGDGTLQPTLGEECDDGNTTPSDGCSPNCLIEACLDDPDCDDGVFCNGFESCDLQTFKCISGVEPCGGATPLCDESGGTCVECLLETDCDDQLFCSGIEICAAGTCIDGTSPCIGLTPHCIELGSLCVECLDTQDCDDGLFCNGPETCSPAHMCLPGEKPCESGTPFCEEPSICRGCLNDDECQDGLACNGTETCDTQSGVCVAGASPCSGTTPICDEPGICRPCQSDGECQDDAFCNGAEQCSGTGACTLGLPPCWNPTPACDEGTDTCTPCVSDDECTDGRYCNGPEICTETGTCAPGTPPCTSPEPICDEDNAVCVGCLDDTHCDDGKFCTGPESCDLGTNTCVFSGSPCTAPLLCSLLQRGGDVRSRHLDVHGKLRRSLRRNRAGLRRVPGSMRRLPIGRQLPRRAVLQRRGNVRPHHTHLRSRRRSLPRRIHLPGGRSDLRGGVPGGRRLRRSAVLHRCGALQWGALPGRDHALLRHRTGLRRVHRQLCRVSLRQPLRRQRRLQRLRALLPRDADVHAGSRTRLRAVWRCLQSGGVRRTQRRV
jgi:cysteine-rich repeat protein